MADYFSTDGLILRAQDYKEADQLLTIYTVERGKIKALVKGVKKTTSKLRGGLGLFGYSRLTLTEGKVFPVIINAEGIDGFASLRADFTRMSYAGYAAELLDNLLVAEEKDDELFELIMKVWPLLAGKDPWLAVKVLEVRILERMGYQLQLATCLHCGEKLKEQHHYRGIIGGVLCKNCGSRAWEEANVVFSLEVMAGLKALQNMDWQRLEWVAFSSAGKKQLDNYLELQLDAVLERPLKTRSFIRQMI